MRDQDARNDIVRLRVANDKLAAENQTIARALNGLREAFDALFDVVAQDLGYEAERIPSLYSLPMLWYKTSPRKLAKTAPKPEIIRTPTARCRKTKP